eukprot:9378651-Prorocentrum_lima.AAC.1
MTSSLVGSEMCIRDSLWAAGCLAPSPRLPCRRGPPMPWCRCRPLWWCSVSYTHLTLPTICSV